MSTTISPYDSSLSFLHKKADELGVPTRFVLVQPRDENDAKFVDSFDLEDNQDAIFTTVFQVIKDLVTRDQQISLTQLWEIISKFPGDPYPPLELIPMWLHAIPRYRTENILYLQQVNEYLDHLNEPTKFNSMAEVVHYYQNGWLPAYNRELATDTQRLHQYLQIQNELVILEPVRHSPVRIDSVVINYDYPQEPGINPLPDLFNSIKTSYLIPFAQFNIKPVKGQVEEIPRYYKIYRGRSIESRPDYNNSTLLGGQASRANSIYLNVWTGPNLENEASTEEEARKDRKEAFDIVTITYLSQNNLLRVEFRSPHTNEVDEKTIITRIHRHIPILKAPMQNQIREIRVGGNIVMYGIGLIEVVLLHMIMNNPLFSAYFYLEESGKSFAEKSRLNINYRGASTELEEGKGYRSTDKRSTKGRAAVSATVTQDQIEVGNEFEVWQPDGTSQKFRASETIPVLNIQINRATSRQIVDKFINVLSRLLFRYSQHGEAIKNYYLAFVPEYASVLASKSQIVLPESLTQTGEIPSPSKQLSRNARLRKYAGDVFVANYARSCQKNRQPEIILNSTEEAIWRAKMIPVMGGEPEKRQILPFPPDTGKYRLVCPDDKFPYPGLIKNITDNRNVYPEVPCCFVTNQMNSDRISSAYKGIAAPVKQIKTRKLHTIKGDKFLGPGRQSIIATIISSYLSQYDSEVGTFYRYGVHRSPNSFIHCVALARQHSGYLAASDPEAWVSEFRSKLFTLGIRPAALRQELFDMTDDEIVRYTLDPDRFFDPLLFYRAIELYFDCNIYVFSRKDEDHETKRKMSMLQLPRHNRFHVRPPNPGKSVVLIMRHWGGNADPREYPQCELIIDQRTAGTKIVENIMQYSDSMDKLMYEAISFISRTISWQIFETPDPTLTARLNVYSDLNYPLIFGQIPVVAQFIDIAGKARIFALAPEINQATQQYTDLRIFLNIPPTAPLNVPEFIPADISGILPPYQKLIEFLGNPIGATVTIDQQSLTGLWFPMGDIQFGFYAPCREHPWSEISRIYPNLSLNSELASLTVDIPRAKRRQSQIQRITYLRKAARFVDQILKYMFLLAQPISPEQFVLNIGLMLDPSRKFDSTTIYNLSRIPRILPSGNLSQVISALSQQIPTMFQRDRIWIYNEQMYKGVLFELRRFARDIEGLPVTPNQFRQIYDYYSNKTDFAFDSKHEFILGSLREYTKWRDVYVPSPSLQQRTIQNLKDNIQISLNHNAFAYQEPYIYQKSDNNTVGSSYDPRKDRFYLIQNVAGGEINRAIQVALIWYTEKRNIGYDTEPYESDDGLLPAHIIYRISPGGGTIVEVNNSGSVDVENAVSLEILNYKIADPSSNEAGYYAAMLPIL